MIAGRLLQPPNGQRSAAGTQSLAWRWLPELDFVALRVDDPAELPILSVIGLVEDVAAFGAKCLEKCGEVVDSVIDHEGRLARRELVSARPPNGPDRGSLHRVATAVLPHERGPT